MNCIWPVGYPKGIGKLLKLCFISLKWESIAEDFNETPPLMVSQAPLHPLLTRAQARSRSCTDFPRCQRIHYLSEGGTHTVVLCQPALLYA